MECDEFSCFQSSVIPDVNVLIESMLRRTSKNSSAMTPKSSDRSDRIETTTTITPRERPKIGRNASQAPTPIKPVQRRLIPGNRKQHYSVFFFTCVLSSVRTSYQQQNLNYPE